ncbi:hypothetical protein ACLOJK_026287 [Asimina triloba]
MGLMKKNVITTSACFLCLLLCVAQADLLGFLKSLDKGHRHSSATQNTQNDGPRPNTPKPSNVPAAPVTGPGAFDVSKLGAVGDGKTENSKAFQKAWNAACSFAGKSTVVVPAGGEFLLGAITFEGPCSHGSPSFVIQGTLKAVPQRSAFPEDAWMEFVHLDGLTMSGGGIVDGQGQDTWDGDGCPDHKCKSPPINLKFRKVNNSEIHDLYVRDSKGFHINFYGCENVRIYNMDISSPEDSPNTDGIHISRSTNIHISNCNIGVGDDCISIGAGNHGITVDKVFCGPGHGISVGSLGKYDDEEPVSDIYVSDCTLVGTTNGVRIKTWPGSPVVQADNFTFEDITMSNVQFPIIIDQKYCPSRRCSNEPSNVKISNIVYKNIKGTSFSKLAVNLACSAAFPCQNIQLADIDLTYQDPNDKVRSLCYNAHVSASGVQNPPPCLIKQ